MKGWDRIILHIDMDAFFAAIEIMRHPEYRGKPVVVGGRGNPRERGVVSTASYEARQYGIRSAMPLREAYRRCPHAIFLPVDHSTYAQYSARVMDILRRFSPLVEVIGLDEAFLDITNSPLGSPEEIARSIKEMIRKETGLTASIGIAPNKLLAKIASDMNKPDGLTVIRPEEVASILEGLPTSRLWGIGPKTEARLRQVGIHTVGQLARTPLEQLVSLFGKALGHSLKERAQGIDPSPVVPFHEPKSFSRERTFQRDTSNIYLLRQVLYRLTKEVWQRCQANGYLGKTVTLKIRYANFHTITRAHTLAAHTDSLDQFWQAIQLLWRRIDWNRPVRLVGIRISSLRPKDV